MYFADWTPGQGQQPFVLSQGDPWGYGLHADFVSGWDTGVLSNLISTCNAGDHGDGLDSCPDVEAYSGSPTSCTVASANPSEVVKGTLDALPGCNPLQYGPEEAKVCDCTSGKPVCDGIPSIPSSGSGNQAGLGGSPSTTSEKDVAGSGSSGGNGGNLLPSAPLGNASSYTSTVIKTYNSTDDNPTTINDKDALTCDPGVHNGNEDRRRHPRHLAGHRQGFRRYSF